MLFYITVILNYFVMLMKEHVCHILLFSLLCVKLVGFCFGLLYFFYNIHCVHIFNFVCKFDLFVGHRI